jgi:DNA polymerase gamma 1
MAALQATNNPAFIKAQITKDDKELREIIKEVTKTKAATSSAARSVRNGSKSTNFPSAEPQKAVLMDIDSRLYRDFRYLPQGSRHPHFNINRQTWKPRPAARP